MKTFALTTGVSIFLVVSTAVMAQAPKTEVTTFQLGNQLTVIPPPEGFEEAAGQFESIRNQFSRTEAPANDMLAVHLPREEADKLRAGGSAVLNFYTKVSVRKGARELDYSAERFAELVAAFRKTSSQVLDINGPTMKGAIEQLNKGLSELNKNETKVAISQPINVGEFDTRPNVYGVILLSTLKSKTGDTEVTVPLVAGLTYLRVKQRLIYVYTYRKYNSATDVEILRDFTRQWITKILAAN